MAAYTMLQGISSNPNNLEPTFISTSRFVQSWCQYRFYQDTEYIRTDTGARKNPSYKHEHMFKISKKYVDHKVLGLFYVHVLVQYANRQYVYWSNEHY